MNKKLVRFTIKVTAKIIKLVLHELNWFNVKRLNALANATSGNTAIYSKWHGKQEQLLLQWKAQSLESLRNAE